MYGSLSSFLCFGGKSEQAYYPTRRGNREDLSFEQQPPLIFENLFRGLFQLCIMVTEYKNLNYVVDILYVY